MPRADIRIEIGGSQAQTINARADALMQLSRSVVALRQSLKSFPAKSISKGMSASASSVRNYSRAIQHAQQRTDRFGTTIKRGGNVLDNFGTLFKRMVRIMAAYLIITTLIQKTKEFLGLLIMAPQRMELWSTQLRVLTGSATTAAEQLELLKEVAIDTPLELPDLFEGLNTLRAFNVEVSQKSLPLLADWAAAMNKTFREVAQVAGKVIIGSSAAITRSLPVLGINPEEFKRLAAETGNRADALFQILEEKFAGFAMESARTATGIASNIRDAWFVVMADIGSGGLSVIKKALQDIMDLVQGLRRDPMRLQDLRDKMTIATASIRRGVLAIIDFGRWTKKAWDAVGGLTTALVVMGTVLATIMVSGLIAWVAALNPVTILLALIVTTLGVLITRAIESLRVQGLNADVYAELGRQIKGVNDALRENIHLVDAQLAIRNAARLKQGAGVGTDLAGRIGDLAPAPPSMLSIGEEANRSGTGVAAPMKRARAILVERQKLLGETRLFFEAMQELGTEVGGHRGFGIAKMARAGLAAALTPDDLPKVAHLINGITHDLGMLEGQQRQVAASAIEAARLLKESQEEAAGAMTGDGPTLAEQLKSQMAIVSARFDAGLLTTGEAVHELTGILSTAQGAMEGFLMSADLDAQKVGIALLALVDAGRKLINTITELGTLDLSQATDVIGIFDDRINLLRHSLAQGVITQEQFNVSVTAMAEEMMATAAQLREISKDPIVLAVIVKLEMSAEALIEELKKQLAELTDPMETALRTQFARIGNFIGDALGEMLVPNQQAQETTKQKLMLFLASVLDAMGTALIQAGLASEAMAGLLASFGAPGAGTAAIVAGLAAKAIAAAMRNSVGNAVAANSGTGAGGRAPSGVVSLPPLGMSQQAPTTVNVFAWDSKGVGEFLNDHKVAFGQAVAELVQEDLDTNGSAHGIVIQ